jgi:hypothetical protein
MSYISIYNYIDGRYARTFFIHRYRLIPALVAGM